MDADAPPLLAVRDGQLGGVEWQYLQLFAIDAQPGQTIAEIGFGQGLFTLRLAKTVGPTGRVIARDIDERRMASLQRLMGVAGGVPNIEARLSRPDDVLIAPEQADTALLADVYNIIALHQDETKGGFLRSLFAALKPGGVVVVVNVATGKRWSEPQEKIHRTTVEDFTQHGFLAGQRWIFEEGGQYRAEVLEFQRPPKPEQSR
jgi:predicted methyltransferase